MTGMLNQTYILWMAGSILVTAVVHYFTAAGLKNRVMLTLLTMLTGTVFGIVFARIGYCLLQPDYALGYGLVYVLLSDDMSLMSFFCGAIGCVLGAMLAAKCTGNKIMSALNAYAPAGALIASLARFGEHFLGTLFAGSYLENEAFCFFPIAVCNEWEEWYLAVHLYTGLLYLIIAIAAIACFKEKRFLRTVYCLCLAQIICESLRNQSLIWSQFIRAEQLLCMVVILIILALLSIKLRPKARRFIPVSVALLCAGVFVAVEFAVGGKILNGVHPAVFYAVMLLGLGVLGIMEHRLIRRQSK